MKAHYKISRKLLALIFSSALITACSDSDNDNKAVVDTDYAAIIAGVSADFTSSNIEIIDLQAESLEAFAGYADSDQSDIAVDAYGQYFYRIGRFQIDNITKYNINDPDTAIWQYSVADDGEDGNINPYDLVFISETKAYLLRYNSSTAWIVNPAASSADAFKIGELDLSAYAGSDGAPEMVSGVIVDGKLYIAMQRLTGARYVPNETAYIAVFDTATDKEVDTFTDTENSFKGIPLKTKNPELISYHADAGLIVQSVGDYGSSWEPVRPIDYTGGIEKINIEDYSSSILIDDGDNDDHPYGLISAMSINSATSGYFAAYYGWQDTALFRFNPSTGEVAEQAMEGLEGLDIRDLTTGPKGNTWASIGDDAGNGRVVIVNPASDSIEVEIDTVMNPTSIVFSSVE